MVAAVLNLSCTVVIVRFEIWMVRSVPVVHVVYLIKGKSGDNETIRGALEPAADVMVHGM
jgi:hypothetical protein